MTGYFVSTYMRQKKGSHAEKIVWEAIKEGFKERECVGYWNYPIFDVENVGKRNEPDILLLDKTLGITIIEVKGITINQIVSIQGHKWNYQDFYQEEGNPYQQAEDQMFKLMDWVRGREGIPNDFTRRVLVALPYITKKEWQERKFDQLPSNPPILFKEDLAHSETLMDMISSVSMYGGQSSLNDEEWTQLTELIHGSKIPEKIVEEEGPKYSLLYIASTEQKLQNADRFFRSLLDKGIKVIVLAPHNRKPEWFSYDFYHKYEEAYLFQYITSEKPYALDEPIMMMDGKGVDETFEKNWLDKFPRFNKGQYKVEHAPVDGNLIITAGAGTGKTTVMIQRIMYLLAIVPGISLKDIVMITFTRESSQEMKHRLKQELVLRQKVTRQPIYLQYAEELREMNISTIHSFAKSLIQELGFVLGFGRNVRLKSYKTKRRVIIGNVLNEYVAVRSIEELGLNKFRHYELIKIIETFWDEMEQKGLNEHQILNLKWREGKKSNDLFDQLNELFMYVFPRCEAEFNKVKLRENAITIGDLVRKISEINSENPQSLNELSSPFRYLFVDEFQDSDDVQIQLVAQINKIMKTKLFVVGDIKQSIYRFRGADYTAFEQLRENVEEKFIEEPLQINYRTSKTLLERLDGYFKSWGQQGHLTYETKDKLIGNEESTFGMNEFRVKKYNKWADELQERVVEEVVKAQELIQNQQPPSKKKKIALLVRTNNQARRAYDWLTEKEIPAEMNVGGTFFNSDAVKDFYRLLGALLYPNDAQSVLNALATPFFQTEVLLNELVKYKGNNDDILSYLREKHDLEKIFEQEVRLLRIKPVFAVIRHFMKENILQNLYSRKLAFIEGDPTEQQKMNATFEVQKYQTNLNHLMNLLHQQFDSTNASLYSLYSWLGIQIKTNRNEDEPRVETVDTEDIVEIVTVHKSKGLEYHTVIMPFTDQPFHFEWDELLFDDDKKKVGWYIKKLSLENQYYDKLNHLETEEIVKEETRLLYVAMTRTRERLIIFQPKKSIDETWSEQLDIRN